MKLEKLFKDSLKDIAKHTPIEKEAKTKNTKTVEIVVDITEQPTKQNIDAIGKSACMPVAKNIFEYDILNTYARYKLLRISQFLHIPAICPRICCMGISLEHRSVHEVLHHIGIPYIGKHWNAGKQCVNEMPIPPPYKGV